MERRPGAILAPFSKGGVFTRPAPPRPYRTQGLRVPPNRTRISPVLPPENVRVQPAQVPNVRGKKNSLQETFSLFSQLTLPPE
jgi:hypothetical protein